MMSLSMMIMCRFNRIVSYKKAVYTLMTTVEAYTSSSGTCALRVKIHQAATSSNEAPALQRSFR